MFTLQPSSGIPIYRQLMEQIRHLIASAQLKPGDTLPSVRELALQHAVNPMTISRAYSMLEAEGLLERQRGKAMMVSASSAIHESREARLARLQPHIDALLLAAEQLELTRDDVIAAITDTKESCT